MLLSDRLNPDCANMIAKHMAATVIQSFYRRSIWRVVYMFHDQPYVKHYWPSTRTGPNMRYVKYRYKPLGLTLKAMMKEIIKWKAHVQIGRRNKRKKSYYAVYLVRRFKEFGDIPIISVKSDMCPAYISGYQSFMQ